MELRSEASSNGAHTMNFASPTVTTGMEEPMKRKRGRPRKYQPDNNNTPPMIGGPPLAVSPLTVAVVSESISGGGGGGGAPAGGETVKKARGRPPGSLNKKKHLPLAESGSTGVGFTPHVITVKTGEDIYSKIMSFSQQCPSAVCILSANGAISSVTLHQAATSGGTVTYEGRYEILSLSGSFLITNSGGQRSRTGGLSVSLAGPDGRVLGGGVEGLLTAAAPVQVVVGSFLADDNREMKQLSSYTVPTSAPPKLAPVRMTGINSPSSQGVFISGASASPHNQSSGTYSSQQHQQNLPNMPWKQG